MKLLVLQRNLLRLVQYRKMLPQVAKVQEERTKAVAEESKSL